ncbi:tropomodulin-3 [Platysternon megacephalum]|uniref:Tropomodulin-3 n=1 Tax=Platysternon megacephalum TaxID=55544 RepID=A0A4D9EAJ5_9SAUR|nr:tropomodulin-3 [Platysternon megacephalum]
MRLPSGMWLWFCLASVTQAGPASRCPWHQPCMGDVCYKFVRLRNSFWGAQAWCQANGGRLARPWNPETQALLSHCLAEGEKWWVGLREHPCEKNPAVTSSPAGCSYIIRDSGTIRSRRDTCAQELYFICRFDPSPERDSHVAHQTRESKRETSQGDTRPAAGTGTDTRPAAGTGTDTRPAAGTGTATRPAAGTGTNTRPAAGTGTATRLAAGTGTATRPAAGTGTATRPAAGTGTATRPADPKLDPFTVNPWTLLQEASSDRAIQREASESLLFLSTQLLQASLLSNSSGDTSTPAATSLFQSFSHLLTAMDSSTPTSHWARNQLTEALENTLAALAGIQTVLWEGSCAVESSVTVTSPVASTMLSSRNASSLPRSSYHLAQPVPLTLAFPSASAWGVLLSRHPRVQVRVTVLAVNPFKHLDGKEIRSVGSIFLTANKESIEMQDLPEDIEVGPQSTISSIQCLCNHLSIFGSSFFVVPRTVDIQDTGKLLRKVASNPIGMALLASLLVLHGVVGVWAWRRDQVDVRKVTVTVLADGDPRAHVRYVVQVFTGYRRGAATTAKVVLTLYGTEGRSEPHCLRDPHKPVFERGGLDVFLVTTRSSLGELHNIRLWHDNSGSSPSWYVRQVVVSDVTARRKWHFLCSAWLAADLGDCQLDQVFPAASRSELLSSRHLFCSALVEKVTHDHLWLSVLTHCPWDPFTRLQRLACCLTLLLCTMVVNIMFWRDLPEAGNQALQPGRVLLTWRELVTSVQTVLILLPINLVVGHIFQLVPPQELPLLPTGIRLPRASAPPRGASPLTRVMQELKATVGFLSRTKLCLEPEALPQEMDSVPELVRSLCCLVGSHLRSASRRGVEPAEPCLANESYHHLSRHLSHVLGPLQAQLRALDLSKLYNPHDYLQAAGQLQSLLEQLQQPGLRQEPGPARGGRSFPISEPRVQKATGPCRPPREAVFICWVTVAAASLASAYFTVLLSLKLDRQRATSWVISMLLSLLQNIFIMQPLKVKSSAREPRRELGESHGTATGLAQPRAWPSHGPATGPAQPQAWHSHGPGPATGLVQPRAQPSHRPGIATAQPRAQPTHSRARDPSHSRATSPEQPRTPAMVQLAWPSHSTITGTAQSAAQPRQSYQPPAVPSTFVIGSRILPHFLA